jgi:hypothetical protein
VEPSVGNYRGFFMDAIITQNLYDATKRKFSIGSNRLAAFEAGFLAAFNELSLDLFNEGLIDEPVILNRIAYAVPTASGTATSVIPVLNQTYWKTDSDVYYVAVLTSVSAKDLTNIDYWMALHYTTEIDSRFLPQINAGLRYFLQTQGEWVKGDDIDKYAGLSWERAKGAIENALTLDADNAGTRTSPWGE